MKRKNIFCHKMTNYHPTYLLLSDGQKRRFLRAYDHRCAVTLRLDAMQLIGPDVLMLTARQQNKISKGFRAGTGVELRISKTQMNHVLHMRLLTTRQQNQIRRAIEEMPFRQGFQGATPVDV